VPATVKIHQLPVENEDCSLCHSPATVKPSCSMTSGKTSTCMAV